VLNIIQYQLINNFKFPNGHSTVNISSYLRLGFIGTIMAYYCISLLWILLSFILVCFAVGTEEEGTEWSIAVTVEYKEVFEKWNLMNGFDEFLFWMLFNSVSKMYLEQSICHIIKLKFTQIYDYELF
jgi:hypothetical protein